MKDGNKVSDINEELRGCLYFTSNRLSRLIGKMANEEFRITGLSPTYGFLISIVNKREGITQKEIGKTLHMTPSTITRFIDKLENKGFIKRVTEGKNSLIYLTDEGKSLQVEIDKAWNNLHKRYSEIIGEDEEKIVEIINRVTSKIEENY
ncbi:MarR family winged helix-turn-helix transcriptional regulator [Dethiothermospora halolimnae]|uniref:MarR family winged helix-turn-helix transcriptional regulator n=1 Tax=Dethiothermospora halolimnae TaxID=3114390 RepID=UPI003CCC1DB0